MLKINRADAFSSLLRRVHLAGLIGECVVNIEDGSATVEALDCSNSVFVHMNEQVSDEGSVSFGLGSIGTLSKFLNQADDAEMEIKKKGEDSEWLVAKRKKHGTIRMLLLDPEEVPTNVEDDSAKDKIVKKAKIRINITETNCNRLVELMTLVGSTSVQFSVKNDKVTVGSLRHDPQQFSTSFGKVAKGKGKEFTVRVFSEHLVPIIKELEHGSEDKPLLLLGEDAPVIIQQGDSRCWAMMPIQED